MTRAFVTFALVTGLVGSAHAEGLLYVSSTPGGAHVAVDGKLTPHKTPVQLLLSGGVHKVSVMKTGHETALQRVKVVDSKVVRIQLTLAPAGQASRPRAPQKRRRPLVTGSATLVTDVIGASIALDGKPTGLKTPITVRIPVGRHTIRLSYGNAYVDETVTIHKGNNAQIRVNLKPTLQRQRDAAARPAAAPQNSAASDPTYPARLQACLKTCKHKRFEGPCNVQQEQCIARCPGRVAGKIVNPGYFHPCADTCKSRRQYCLDSFVSQCKTDCTTNPPR